MTPTQFLEHAAALMDERPEVRPTRDVCGRSLHLRYHLPGQGFFWHDDHGPMWSSLPTWDALAHIVATWSERVAAAGITIWMVETEEWKQWFYGHVYDRTGNGDTMAPTYLAALLAAVEATIES